MKTKIKSVIKVSAFSLSMLFGLSSFASEVEKDTKNKNTNSRTILDGKVKSELNKKMVFPFEKGEKYVGDVIMKVLYINGNPKSISFESNNQNLADYVQTKVGEMDFEHVNDFSGIINYKLKFIKE